LLRFASLNREAELVQLTRRGGWSASNHGNPGSRSGFLLRAAMCARPCRRVGGKAEALTP
jgi:hypothetical protein